MISSRFFSKGPIPTSSTAEVGGVKVIGLDHLSVRCHDGPRIEVFTLFDSLEIMSIMTLTVIVVLGHVFFLIVVAIKRRQL